MSEATKFLNGAASFRAEAKKFPTSISSRVMIQFGKRFVEAARAVRTKEQAEKQFLFANVAAEDQMRRIFPDRYPDRYPIHIEHEVTSDGKSEA